MLTSLIELVTVCAAIFISETSSQCFRRDGQGNCRQRTTQAGSVIFITNALRQQGENALTGEPNRPRRKCCPYDFDSKICRTIDDRVLCGYNRNSGYPNSKDHIIEMSEGCRMRNGRLECGYSLPPYTNPRRPPPWDYPLGDLQEDANIIENSAVLEEKLKQHKKRVSKGPVKPLPTYDCVEINDRIVCPTKIG